MRTTNNIDMFRSASKTGMTELRASCVTAALAWVFCVPAALAAELSVQDLKIRPNGTGTLMASGALDGESTYGVTLMVELVPRPGTRGTLEFTRAIGKHPGKAKHVSVQRRADRPASVRIIQAHRPDMDIVQLGDPWPSRGTFTPFDTDESYSASLNGAVDDNGTFSSEPTNFSGALAAFPVKASANAQGVWDVTLSTSKGESGWEGLTTTLIGGTITVTRSACLKDVQCKDKDPCTIDTCERGSCLNVRQQGPCGNVKQSRKRLGTQRRTAGDSD